jgi:hypothetical protein
VDFPSFHKGEEECGKGTVDLFPDERVQSTLGGMGGREADGVVWI